MADRPHTQPHWLPLTVQPEECKALLLGLRLTAIKLKRRMESGGAVGAARSSEAVINGVPCTDTSVIFG